MIPEYFTNNVIFLTSVDVLGRTIVHNTLDVYSTLTVGESSADASTLYVDENVGILTETPNVELTVNGKISSNSVIYDAIGNSLEWNSVHSTVLSNSAIWELAGGTLVNNITSDLTVGAISAGQILEYGTSLQDFAEKLLIKVFYPIFTLPSATLTSNLNANVESGTKNITLTVNLNKGAITGKSVNGIWQPNLFQNYRSGDATKYTIFDVDNGTTVSYTSADATILDGSNVFSATVNYDQGSQPLDSKNNNYLTPLNAGSLIPTLTINGRRKAFYGVDNVASNSSQIRSLSNSLLNPSNGSSFTINIPTGSTNVVFAYPASLRDVTTVEYVQGLGSDVKANFVKTTVNVEGLNGYTATPYKVYNYTPTGVGGVSVPFSQAVTYIVTI